MYCILVEMEGFHWDFLPNCWLKLCLFVDGECSLLHCCFSNLLVIGFGQNLFQTLEEPFVREFEWKLWRLGGENLMIVLVSWLRKKFWFEGQFCTLLPFSLNVFSLKVFWTQPRWLDLRKPCFFHWFAAGKFPAMKRIRNLLVIHVSWVQNALIRFKTLLEFLP